MDASGRRVSEVMKTEVATLGVRDRLDLAEDVMRLGRIRHMPVLDGTRLVGIVSSRDLLAASLSKVLDFQASDRRTFLRSVEVAEVMSHDLITVERSASLREVAALMVRHRIGCVPVVAADRTFLGLITETDLLTVALLAEPEGEASAAREETIVTEWKDRVQREIEELRGVRDDLKVRMHLAKADLKDLFEALEKPLQRLEAKGRQISQASEEPLRDVREAARLLIEEIRDGYRRIRDAL
jgi:CBS domain-containing protein